MVVDLFFFFQITVLAAHDKHRRAAARRGGRNQTASYRERPPGVTDVTQQAPRIGEGREARRFLSGLSELVLDTVRWQGRHRIAKKPAPHTEVQTGFFAARPASTRLAIRVQFL
jgi:hypothetical protein